MILTFRADQLGLAGGASSGEVPVALEDPSFSCGGMAVKNYIASSTETIVQKEKKIIQFDINDKVKSRSVKCRKTGESACINPCINHLLPIGDTADPYFILYQALRSQENGSRLGI